MVFGWILDRMRFLPALLLLALLVVVTACGSGEPTPTSTPTPLPPFTIASGSTGADLLGQLPTSEQACVRAALAATAFDALMEATASAEVSLLEQEQVMGSLLECLSSESATRLFIGGVATEAGGLSSTTVVCMRNVLGNFDIRGLLANDPGEDTASLSGLMGMMLCLSDEEAQRVNIGGSDLLGLPSGTGATLAQIRCAIQYVELNAIFDLLSAINQMETPSLDVLIALADCGVGLRGAGGPDIDGDQLRCLRGQLGEDSTIGLLLLERFPTASELAALAGCGVSSPDG